MQFWVPSIASFKLTTLYINYSTNGFVQVVWKRIPNIMLPVRTPLRFVSLFYSILLYIFQAYNWSSFTYPHPPHLLFLPAMCQKILMVAPEACCVIFIERVASLCIITLINNWYISWVEWSSLLLNQIWKVEKVLMKVKSDEFWYLTENVQIIFWSWWWWLLICLRFLTL